MITVSVVSHGHGRMVEELMLQLLDFPEVQTVILTLNVPEGLTIQNNPRIKVVNNSSPRGFGSNHNSAFKICNTSFFCVLNPDIVFQDNPFPGLINPFSDPNVALVSPLVKNLKGGIEDSARRFLTPLSLINRVFLRKSDAHKCVDGGGLFSPEWVGGMFMLFRSKTFTDLKGFDEEFFLYVEDVDICTRVWLSGYKVLINQSVAVVHNARRASKRSFKHMVWHIKGVLRYFVKFSKGLPKLK